MKKSRLNICLALLVLGLTGGLVFPLIESVYADTPHEVHTINGDVQARKRQEQRRRASSPSSSKGNNVNTYSVSGNGGNRYNVMRLNDSVTTITATDRFQYPVSERRVSQGCTFDNDDSVYEYDPQCSSESTTASTRRVIKGIGDFHMITASRLIKIVYTQGKPGDLIIEGNEKMVKSLKVSCQDGELELERSYFGNLNGPKDVLTVTCSSRTLNGITLSSACSFVAERPLNITGGLSIDLSSASDVHISDFKGSSLSVECGSASKVRVHTLRVSALNLDLSSASHFNSTVATVSGDVDLDSSSASTIGIDRLDCEKFTLDCSSASNCRFGQVVVQNAFVDCSSAAKVKINGSLVCNGSSGRFLGSVSSTANLDIDNLKAYSTTLEVSTQGNLNISGIAIDSMHLTTSMSVVTLAGRARKVYIDAGTLARVRASNFDVDEANVEATRQAEVTIKAGKINYQ